MIKYNTQKGAHVSKRKIVIISSVIVIILSAGLVAWSVVFGRALLPSTQADNQSASAPIVCGVRTVDTYNDAMLARSTDDPRVFAVDENALAAMVVDIENKPNHSQDPTCRTILFWIAVQKKDYEAAKLEYDAVKAMHEKRVFADSNLRGNLPLFDWGTIVYELSPEAQNQDGGV